MPHSEAGLHVSSALVVFLHEVVVVFCEVGGGRKEGVEFGVDDFHDFWGERVGEGGDGALEAEDLYVGCWV